MAVAMSAPAFASVRPAAVSRTGAVELARRGDFEQALAMFAQLQRHDPDNQVLLYDYLVTLSWAGRDAGAAEMFERIDPERAPRYVLEAAAKSLRNIKAFERAETLYVLAIQRFSSYPPLRLGLLYTLADAGKQQAALRLSQLLEELYPGHIETQYALAYAAERRRDYVAALQHYQRILRWQPESKRAQRLQILALAAAGDPFRAEALATEAPGLLSRAEFDRLKADQAALTVRWGSYGSDVPQRRFDETDRALQRLEHNLATAAAVEPEGSALALRARIDQLVALRDRVAMRQVVAAYRALQREGVSLPPYARQAVADALLYLEQPRPAGELYARVFQEQPDNFEAARGLFFALVEQENFDRGRNLAEHLRAIRAADPRAFGEVARTETEMLAALGRLFGGDLAEAQVRFESMLREAPANIDLLGELGGLYGARGWPRRAAETFGLGLALAPDYLSLRTGWAANRLDLAEFRQAEQLIGELGEQYPEHKAVQRLQRFWQAHNLRELQVSAASGWSSGATFGSHDLAVAATLYSPPVHYRYRGFVASYLNGARFPEGDKLLQRYGAGLEYRGRDFRGSAELTWNASGGRSIGSRLAAVWLPNDAWSVPVTVELFSRETPLRAIKHGIYADAGSVGVTYRQNELRRLSLQAQCMDFSDGNFRYSVLAGLEQALLVWPHYRLDGRLDLYTSANSTTGAPYFNPRRDADVTLTLANDWLLYRHYRFSFRNRLALSAGGYWQQDYGTDPTLGVRYEHVWEYAPRFFLLYGVSFGRRSYDGDNENQLGCHLELNWRI